LLARGARLTELLKQPQFSPLKMEEQACVIYAGVNGYLDPIPVARVRAFEQGLLTLLRSKNADILEDVRKTSDLTDATAGKLKAVVDGYAVYEVLARDGPGFALAHCWAHTKRKYEEIADHWPTACAEIGAFIRELYGIERLVPGPFPGDTAAQTLRQALRHELSRPIVDQIWQWATVQVGLPRSDFGKAVRYMLERWTGLTRFVDDARIPLDNNAADAASGIRGGMLPSGSCRVRPRDRRLRRENECVSVERAA
jgi:hypothetical protein